MGLRKFDLKKTKNQHRGKLFDISKQFMLLLKVTNNINVHVDAELEFRVSLYTFVCIYLFSWHQKNK